MAKLVRTLVLLALVAGVAIFALSSMKKNRDSQSGAAQSSSEQDKQKSKDAPIRTEEKYGFTSQGLGGGG